MSIAQAAPIGAVDAKSITFKKLALNEQNADGKGLNEKGNLPVVAASTAIGGGGGRKVMRINLAGSGEDAIGDVMDGREELNRIFVTLPTTTTTSTSTASVLSTMTVTKESEPVTSDTSSFVTLLAEKSPELVELFSSTPIKTESTVSGKVEENAEVATQSARIIQVSTNTQESEANGDKGGITLLPGMSIEDPDKKIDNQNIQNLVLQADEEVEEPLSGNSSNNGNRSRKSKGLTESGLSNKRSTGEDAEDEDELIVPSNPEARLQPAANLNRNLLIQFSDNDRLELLNSQNNALTSDDLSPTTRSSNLGLISGIGFSVLTLFCAVSLVGAMLYRRRYINKPQTLSEPDSSGYIDDSIIRVS